MNYNKTSKNRIFLKLKIAPHKQGCREYFFLINSQLVSFFWCSTIFPLFFDKKCTKKIDSTILPLFWNSIKIQPSYVCDFLILHIYYLVERRLKNYASLLTSLVGNRQVILGKIIVESENLLNFFCLLEWTRLFYNLHSIMSIGI